MITKFLVILLILAVISLPFVLMVVLVRMIIKRRRREALESAAQAGGAPRDARPRAIIFSSLSLSDSWMTYSFLIVLSLVYWCELQFGVDHSEKYHDPSLQTLIVMGGVSRAILLHTNEWYRLFTAPLLHGGIQHLVLNCLALFYAGRILEKFTGRVWFLAIFVVSAWGGSLMSIVINPANIVSVGASGAIMGLFAATLVISFHAAGAASSLIRSYSLRMLIPSLLPMLFTDNPHHIDYGCHLGGAVIGGLFGVLMLAAWPPEEEFPGYRKVATTLCAIGLVLFAGSYAFIAKNYSRDLILTKIGSKMIPASEMPKTNKELEEKAVELVAKYPSDPRGHMHYALALEKAHDLPKAESELRLSLTATDDMRDAFKTYAKLKNTESALLADVLQQEGKKAEALQVAATACDASEADRPESRIYGLMVSAHLCHSAESAHLKTCTDYMSNYATSNHIDPAQYIAKNQDYVKKCLDYLNR
jgi:rhomboid protease GluP